MQNGKELKIKKFTIVANDNNLVNASKLCTTHNKILHTWLRVRLTKNIIENLKTIYENKTKTEFNYINIVKGGNCKDIEAINKRGTWLHPLVVIKLLKWLASKYENEIFIYLKSLLSDEVKLIFNINERTLEEINDDKFDIDEYLNISIKFPHKDINFENTEEEEIIEENESKEKIEEEIFEEKEEEIFEENETPKDKIIRKALSKNNLDYLKLAQISDFNDEEIEFVKLFWEPTFNKNWIYLSKQMVVEWLGYEDAKNTMSNFYTQNLIKNYEEDLDYKEVDKNNEIIKKFCSLKIATEKHVHNKKYYIVKGDCLKSLLMSAQTSKGKQVRKIYIKTEDLVFVMLEVIKEQHRLSYENKIKEQEKIIKAKEEENKWLHIATKKNVNFLIKDQTAGFIYCGRHPTEAKEYIRKIGYTTRNTNTRTSEHSISTSDYNKFNMEKTYQSYLPIASEKYIHQLLDSFMVKINPKKTEHFMIHNHIANLAISTVLNCESQVINIANNYINLLNIHDKDYEKVQDILDKKYNEIIEDNSEDDQEEVFEDVKKCRICKIFLKLDKFEINSRNQDKVHCINCTNQRYILCRGDCGLSKLGVNFKVGKDRVRLRRCTDCLTTVKLTYRKCRRCKKLKDNTKYGRYENNVYHRECLECRSS